MDSGFLQLQSIFDRNTTVANPFVSVTQTESVFKFTPSDVLLIPSGVAAASLLVLALQGLWQFASKKLSSKHALSSDSLLENNDEVDAEEPQNPSGFARYLAERGGLAIVVFNLSRLLACLACLGLFTYTTVVSTQDASTSQISLGLWAQVGFCVTLLYSSVLALASLIVKSGISFALTRHLAIVMVSVWAVYAYRNLWPYATYTLSPLDAAEGAVMWVKIAILTYVGVIVPVTVPYPYRPVNPKHPWPNPAGEQTASYLSIALFMFMDRTIWKANQVSHLPLDELPPLADYDAAETLIKQSYPYLDPLCKKKKNQHLGWGLFKIFRGQLFLMAIMCSLWSLFQLGSPYAIKNLLEYMEDPSRDWEIRPWFWISWLFLAPLFGVTFNTQYIFTSTRLLVLIEAIITQLVFDHALRMRMKSEVDQMTLSTGGNTAAPNSETASVAGVSPSGNQQSGEGSESAGSSTVGPDTDSAKGKQKAQSKPAEDKKSAPKEEDKSKEDKSKGGKNVIGKINNLITSDLQTIGNGRDFMLPLVQVPVQMVSCVIFLYSILGWSAFTGMAVIILLFPLPGKVATVIRSVHAEKMKKTDARVQSVTETMNVIRMVKLFGWEPRMNQQLGEKREVELKWIRKNKILDLVNMMLNHLIPIFTMIVTYVTYTVIMKQQLTASKVFSSITVFDMFSRSFHMVFGMTPQVMRAKVALDRLNEFLQQTELLDSYTEKPQEVAIVPLPADVDPEVIGFRHASFTWANEENKVSTPSTPGRSFTLRIEDELTFKRGCINLIVGPTGSGKTSLLMALLGEMHYISMEPDAYFNLPRGRGVAYAAQESWVQNETIRENILFGAPYDPERYKKVIDQCGLKRDLELFDAGDLTEVGEKGITLSGGQKARVTLARAVYSTAEILLLDDVLAALDVHTSQWIVDKCFKGDLIQGRTVLLVTHNVALTQPIARFVVSMGSNGRIASQGTILEAFKDQAVAKEFAEDSEAIEKAEQAIDEPEDATKKSAGKLVVAEEIAEGHVGWQLVKQYCKDLGGMYWAIFWVVYFGANIGTELFGNLEIWYLGYWASQYETRPAEEVNVAHYMTFYVLLITGTITFYIFGLLIYIYGSIRASRSVHKVLISSMLGTTLRWLDQTPTSRIIARCTQDISAVDGQVPMFLRWCLELIVAMALKLGAVVLISPIFIFPGILLTAVGVWIGNMYMKAQLSVKRERSNARAPVLGHFGAAFAGLVSIRAYGAQDAFRKESYKRINLYTRASRTFWNLNRWVGVRIQLLGSLFTVALASYLVYGQSSSASKTGFSLNMAVGFSNMIMFCVRMFNEFEVAGNSLERIQQYVEVEQESKPTESGKPPAYWPASGDLKVEKLSARYSNDGPRVLQEISFEVKSGERVGIVGRTGSGKSSLTLALLRCIIAEGKVYYDGIPTESINLDALRSSITIIPQMPELLSGTLRHNLDPFEEYEDAVLNDALRSAGLFALQEETDEGRITLDTEIASGGSNLSVGQRQILALARAIVRKSKLLILDEATSAIDYATDAIIQESLRKELGNGVTILTVAHRLQTIMDSDKIMVLDAGEIAEFGKPSELLKNEKGFLRALVNESNDKEILHAMASGSRASS